MPFIGDQDLEQLSKAGISTIQELLFPTKEIKKSSVLGLENIENLRKHLEKKIEELDVKDEILVQIKQLGINLIKEFIIYPSAVLDSQINLSYLAIKGLKNRIPIKTKKIPKEKSTTKESVKSTAKASTPKTQSTKEVKTPSQPRISKTSKKTKTSPTKEKETKTLPKQPSPKSIHPKSTKQTTLLDLSPDKQKQNSAKSTKSSSKSIKRSNAK